MTDIYITNRKEILGVQQDFGSQSFPLSPVGGKKYDCAAMSYTQEVKRLRALCTSFSYMKPTPAVWPTPALRSALQNENMGVCLTKEDGKKKYPSVFSLKSLPFVCVSRGFQRFKKKETPASSSLHTIMQTEWDLENWMTIKQADK